MGNGVGLRAKEQDLKPCLAVGNVTIFHIVLFHLVVLANVHIASCIEKNHKNT